ncbi:MAG: cysteine synthase family protein [Candidatus Moraniibacteriota bacterium]
MLKKNLIQSIGQTPLIKLDNFLENKKINLFVKLEGQNPGGSIKDRVALYMIKKAQKNGSLKKGQTILEATSGNMGISLAMLGAYFGYSVEIVMSEGMSEERKKMLRALGAKLILTPAQEGTGGAIKKARDLKKRFPEKYWFSDQFNNPDNTLAHYYSLAPELLKESPSIDYLIAGTGTSGTLMGIARRFKKDSPQTKIIEVNPPGGYKIQGLQNPIEDFGGKIYTPDLVEKKIKVSTEDAYQTANRIARTEGLFVGMSSGAFLWAAKKISRQIKSGNIIVILPDRGEKYLSTSLFK